MSNQPSLSRRPLQAGFSLIEVLVAILILSIGVVGVAGVQIASTKFNQVSQQRSIASQHASSIAERMRANLAAVRWPVTNYIFDFPYAGIPAGAAALVASTCSVASPCTPEQVARTNVKDWLTQLEAALPGGRGTITQNVMPPAAGVPYVVTVMWEEKELGKVTGGDGSRATASCPLGTPDNVQCVRLEFQP